MKRTVYVHYLFKERLNIFIRFKVYLRNIQRFANLSTNLLKELPMPTNLFGIDSVQKYYSNLNQENKQFSLQPTTEEIILKLLQEINFAKAVGIDNIGGKFLKD